MTFRKRYWWTDYSAYLDTEEWHRRRALVMQRARGRCEGCRERDATQVHHLTYENVGEEFLWQLVAVCNECHERFHGAKVNWRARFKVTPLDPLP